MAVYNISHRGVSFPALIVLILMAGASAAGQSSQRLQSGEQKSAADWVKFSPKDAPFSVLFPRQPSAGTKEDKSGLKVHMYKVKTTASEYQVIWLTNVPRETLLRGPLTVLFPRGLEDVLRTARHAAQKELITTRDENVALNGYQGRESTMESASASIQAEAFIAGHDFIALAVLHPKDEASTANALRFLKSLSLLTPAAAAASSGVAAGANSSAGVDTRPVPLNHPRPNYTQEATRDRVEGVIRMRALVGADGVVHEVRLLSHLPDGLDAEAIAAVQHMRFKPATKAGQAVSWWVALEIEFKL